MKERHWRKNILSIWYRLLYVQLRVTLTVGPWHLVTLSPWTHSLRIISTGGEFGASECLGYRPPIPSEFSLNIHAVSYLTQSMTLDSLSSTICLFLWGYPPLSTSTIILLSRRPTTSRGLCALTWEGSISLTDDKSHTPTVLLHTYTISQSPCHQDIITFILMGKLRTGTPASPRTSEQKGLQLECNHVPVTDLKLLVCLINNILIGNSTGFSLWDVSVL